MNVAIISDAGKSRFIEIALSGKLNDKNLISYKILTAKDLSTVELNKFDMIICGSGDYHSGDIERLKQYISAGGGIFLFANYDTPEDITRRFIAELGFGPLAKRTFSTKDPARFISLDRNHPIFKDVF